MAHAGQPAQPLGPRADNEQFYTGPIYPLFDSGEYVGLYIVNGISMLCSLFVVGFIHMYRNTISMVAATRQRGKRRTIRQTIRRPIGTQASVYLQLPVSLRLLFIASIIDVLYSGFRIYNIIVSTPGFSGNKEVNCEASMTGVTFFNLMSVFVRALLSVHLQLVILNNVRRALTYERHFLLAAFVVSLAVSIVPLFTHNYVWLNFDPTMGSAHCGYFPLHRTTDDLQQVEFVWTEHMAQKAIRKGLIIMWSTNFAWVTLTVFYGTMVIVAVVIRLAHQHNTLNRIADGQGMILEQAYRRKREFLLTTAKVVRRILQFPMMVVVCHILEVVFGMIVLSQALTMIRKNTVSSSSLATNHGLRRLYLASQFMLGMEGIITLFFLPLEPPIRLMLRRQYRRRKSDLRRLGTTRKSVRKSVRRRRTENWPSARPRSQVPGVDCNDGSLYLPSPWCDEAPTMYVQDASQNPHEVDHFVTKSIPDEGSSNLHTESCPAMPSSKTPPLRASTVRWRRNQPNSGTISRPAPVHRANTLAEFQWDVVAVPRQSGSSAVSPSSLSPPQPQTTQLSEHDISSTVLALRNDGLPAHQWYVPESLSRAITAADVSKATYTNESGNDTLVTTPSQKSTDNSVAEA